MSLSTKKPIPINTAPERNKCPVCGTSSYSASGMHPQCALKLNEASLRAAQIAAGDEPPPPRQSWSRQQWRR